MSEQLNPTPLPANLKQASQSLRLTGWIAFWTQLVLAVISSVILLLYAFSTTTNRNVEMAQGTGFGIFFAICGLVTLGVSIYWAFRYTRLSRQLKDPIANLRPSKSDTINVVRWGVIVNLLGMLLTLVGAQAIIGSTLARSLAQQPGVFTPTGTIQFIQPLDLFVVQANTNTIFAHFAGVVAALWLLGRLHR
jgi:hypothetical protein